MTEAEWMCFLGELPPDTADLAANIVERCATIIAQEQQRHLKEEEVLQCEVTKLRRELSEIRARVGPQERAVGE